MDYGAFYGRLFRSVEERIGPLDHDALMAIVGFDALRVVGLTRRELQSAVDEGSEQVLSRLKLRKMYPRIRTKRMRR